MKRKAIIVAVIFFALIGIACLIGWLTGFFLTGGTCHQNHHYTKAIVLKKVMSKDSLQFDLAYKKVSSTSDTVWEHYTRNWIGDADEISKFEKIKINDTITHFYCEILTGSCAGKQELRAEKYPYKNDTIVYEK